MFDRSDELTWRSFQSVSHGSFASVTTLRVDVGSLGPARNAGIQVARGEFIWTSDADDLVSENCLYQLFLKAKSHPGTKIAVFCEYCIGFGDQFFVVRYERSSLICAADFALSHPYVSRIFVSRSVFDELKYRDLRISKGFAYEDWDLNARLLARGFHFEIATDTVFFYRQRQGSLLRLSDQHSARLVPHSDLFEPATFTEAMAGARARHPDWERFLATRASFHEVNIRGEALSSAPVRQAIAAASALDPEIAPLKIETASNYCPIPRDQSHWAFHLEDAFALVGSTKFSDVVLLPWLLPGGAEKQIMEAVDTLQRFGNAGHVLFLTGERTSDIGWQERLGGRYVFLDIFNSFPTLDSQSRDELTTRLLLSVAREGARLHIKPAGFSHRLMERFGSALSEDFSIIYYRFCDREFRWNGHDVREQYAVSFLRNQLPNLSSVIYATQNLLRRDVEVLPALGEVAHTVYTLCRPHGECVRASAEPQFRLLWASRISQQKRPEIVRRIAAALLRRSPHLTLHIYGASDGEMVPKDLFVGPNISYRGPFDDFAALPVQDYDALIYTSYFDGLPNIIVEAMSAGLSVIAPRLGGIPEAVTEDTGLLVDNAADERILVEHYVDAITTMYERWDETLRKRDAARLLTSARHSALSFMSGLRLAIPGSGLERAPAGGCSDSECSPPVLPVQHAAISGGGSLPVSNIASMQSQT